MDKQVGQLLSKQQLATHLQVSTKTIDRWRHQGMPWQRKGVKLTRYDLGAVNKWLAKHNSQYENKTVENG